jgi:hypothetical protein
MARKVRKMRISDYFSNKSINPMINNRDKSLGSKLKENLQTQIKNQPFTMFNNDRDGLKVEHIDH